MSLGSWDSCPWLVAMDGWDSLSGWRELQSAYVEADRQTGRQAGSTVKVDRQWPSLTLHVQLSSPAVILNEHGSAQEGRATQCPNESTEHERELQSPELGQEGRGPAPSEAVRDL